MRVKFKLSGTLGDDSWDTGVTDADTSFLGLGNNALAYAIIAAGVLFAMPYLDSAPQRQITSGRKRRSPRRKLTNGVKGKRQPITLKRQSDGSFA